MTSARAAHPDQAELLRFVVSDLGEARRRQVKEHTKRCGSCARALEATRRLDGALRELGDALYFAPGDSFMERPRPAERPLSEFEFGRGVLQMKAREALTAVPERARALFGKAAGTGIDPVGTLDLRSLADRWALGRALESALDNVSAAPRRCLTFAERVGERLGGADQAPYAVVSARRMTAVEYAAPLIDLFALARLVKGAALVEMAKFEEAEVELRSAYRRFGAGRGSEHHFAWVEVFVSRCLSMTGRPGQGLVLAERAHATFENLGFSAGVAEAAQSSGIARYYLGNPEAAAREFHVAEGSFARLERWDSYVATIGCQAFAFMELGRLDKALECYATARNRVVRAEANEAYVSLTADVRLLLERESLWKARRGARPRVHLPVILGAHDGRQVANNIAKAAAEGNLEKAKELLGKAKADSCVVYAYLYTCLRANPRVPSDPAMYIELARTVAQATRSVPYVENNGPAWPVCREQVLGEAGLLESAALNFFNKPDEARTAAQKARASFVEAGESRYSFALIDFFEGSAASFASGSRDARKLLRRACSEFQVYGQEDWQGRSEGAIGVLLTNKEGKAIHALGCFARALRNLRPERDPATYASIIINHAYGLVRLSRFDEARTNYARALPIARRLDLKVSLLMIRYGLASIDLEKGRILRALGAFQRLSSDAASIGLSARVLSAELRIAECSGRLGNEAVMLERLRRLRTSSDVPSVEFEPAIRELFAYVDDRAVSPEVLAHVARFAEARDHGVRVAYKPFGGEAKRA
jgi:tetratricopeptide (TPR) repeat protein